MFIFFIMKKIYLLALLFATISLFAQTNDYKITYDMYNDTEIPNTLKGYLLIDTNTNKSIFKEDYTTRAQVNEKINGVKRTLIKPKTGIDRYFITSNDTLQELKLLGTTYVDVIDTYGIQDWKISDETKIIDKFQVVKATCNFRGRNWEAWFAPDLPFSFGPWKLRGLPGLIIQAYDETKRYNYNLVKIENIRDTKIIDETNSLLSNKIKKLSIKQFLEEEEEAKVNTLNNLLGRDSYEREKLSRNGLEKVYEWEKENK